MQQMVLKRHFPYRRDTGTAASSGSNESIHRTIVASQEHARETTTDTVSTATLER